MSQIRKTDSQVAISSIGTSIIENLELTPYEARISRERPGCFVIMIDQSGSMSKGWGLNSEKSKAK